MVQRPNTNKARVQRHKRVRGKIVGTAECPRLNVFRSLQHIYAQLIDDVNGVTLVSASTVEKDFKDYGGNKDAAFKVGKLLAERAAEKKITDVVKYYLTEKPETRSDDDILYGYVCEDFNRDAITLPFCVVMSNRKKFGLPSWWSVRRVRQKVQEHNEHLRADADTEAIRMVEEEKYRKYARSVV